MTSFDSHVTTIDLTTEMKVARGSSVSDADGTRRATLLVPEGTTAEQILANGRTQAVWSFTVRATEYSVGSGGPDAVPAELPPTVHHQIAVNDSQ